MSDRTGNWGDICGNCGYRWETHRAANQRCPKNGDSETRRHGGYRRTFFTPAMDKAENRVAPQLPGFPRRPEDDDEACN